MVYDALMASTSKGGRAGFAPARLFRETHDQVRELVAHISRHGWSSVGIDRDDPPTGTAVLDAAVSLLSERAKPKKGAK